MDLSEIAVENARTFESIGSLLTLENGALIVAGINVIWNILTLLVVWYILFSVLAGDYDAGCIISSRCPEIMPEAAIMIAGLGTLYSVPMLYLNTGLYRAINDKDEEYVTLWLKITGGLTIVRSGLYLAADQQISIILEVIELWIVHAYEQSREIKKLQGKIPVVEKKT